MASICTTLRLYEPASLAAAASALDSPSVGRSPASIALMRENMALRGGCGTGMVSRGEGLVAGGSQAVYYAPDDLLELSHVERDVEATLLANAAGRSVQVGDGARDALRKFFRIRHSMSLARLLHPCGVPRVLVSKNTTVWTAQDSRDLHPRSRRTRAFLSVSVRSFSA